MNNQMTRPLLLAGLCVSLVSFIAMFVLNMLNYFVNAGKLVEANGLALILCVAVFYSLFVICGLVFSADSMLKCNLPEDKFHKQKKMIITTFIFDILAAVIEIIPLIIDNRFWIVDTIFLVTFIVSAILILIGCKKQQKTGLAALKELE